ncbi:MAG TPA: formylglycine-generating enzyme family protein, partial [Polyangiaceae bacterium]
AGCMAIPLLLACGSEGDADDGGGSDTGGTSGGGGSSGRGGSGGSGNGGSTAKGGSGGGFACTSDASPGELVEVPAGEFIMGCNEDVDSECAPDELPTHTVSLSAFSIERTEVTQDQYAACVTEGACDPPSCEWDCERTDYPAGCINLGQAQTYCEWAGRRLPTEAEWEKAARGEDGAKFPWGNEEADCTLVNMSGCEDDAAAVGSFPDGASPYGALDMAGNMVEMVSDWYDETYYADSPSENPTGPAAGTRYTGRGGGWRSLSVWQRASKRDWYDPADSGTSLGFRCVL